MYPSPRRGEVRRGAARGLTVIELLIALSIGAMVVVVIFQAQRTGILGHKKGTELAASTQSTYLLLEHLKKDARSSLTLEEVSTSSPDTVGYRIGRVMYDPLQANSLSIIEARYIYDQAKAAVRRQEYNLTTHRVMTEREYVFDAECFDFELSGGSGLPVKIGMKLNIDGGEKWLRFTVASSYAAPNADRWIYHTIPDEVLQSQTPSSAPVAYVPSKFSSKSSAPSPGVPNHEEDEKTALKILKAFSARFSSARSPGRR